jgi:hypothetical protein
MDDTPPTPQDRQPQFSRKMMPLLILLLMGFIFVGRSWLSGPSVQQLPLQRSDRARNRLCGA